MKIKIVGSWEFELIPESSHEVMILRKTFKAGHVHFVCKALLRPSPRSPNQRKRLLLTPSVIRWQRPKRRDDIHGESK